MPWEADLRSRSVVQRCARPLLPFAGAFPCQPGMAGGYEDALPHLGIGSSETMARHARWSSDTPLAFSPVTQRGGARVGMRPLYHGCSRPSQVQKQPWSAGVKRVMTYRMPRTLSSTAKGAPAPPMSVRTHPGCSTIAMSPHRPHAGAWARNASLSAALESP
jgi:hypothetical protein